MDVRVAGRVRAVHPRERLQRAHLLPLAAEQRDLQAAVRQGLDQRALLVRVLLEVCEQVRPLLRLNRARQALNNNSVRHPTVRLLRLRHTRTHTRPERHARRDLHLDQALPLAQRRAPTPPHAHVPRLGGHHRGRHRVLRGARLRARLAVCARSP